MLDDLCIPDEVNTLPDLICWALSSIAHPFESQALTDGLLARLKEITGSSSIDLLLYHADMNILFFTNTKSGATAGDKGKLSLADTRNSAPVKALIGNHTVLINDVRESDVHSLSQGSRTLLAVPLICGERIHGVINLEHPQPAAYEPAAVRWIEALSSVLSVLLEHSYLAEQVFRLNQRLIDQIAETASENDPQFRGHAERVSAIAAAIAEEMKLPQEVVNTVRDTGFLHDIGKSGVSKSILVKPGSLDDAEMNEMRRHPVLGRFLLKPLGFQPAVIEGVATHHEKWDGTGYPSGLSGEQIPIAGRILAVAEAYEVMTSDQPYRVKMKAEDALREIQSQAGRQFDPEVVNALLRLGEL